MAGELIRRRSLCRRGLAAAHLLALAFALVSVPASAQVISEFMAENDAWRLDADGDSPDWIEIFHPGPGPVSLAGWSLTDDPDLAGKWIFPDVTLQAGELLVVWASGKNRTDPAAELHTNFRLENNGEFIGLADAAGSFVSFHTRYPGQIADVSYGMAMDVRVTPLVESGAAARYHVPADGTLGAAWTEPGFDDAAWASGPTGLGFDGTAAPRYTDFIGTDVQAALRGVNSSVYLRLPFTLARANLDSAFELRVLYDSGFVAYINGTEVARRNAPAAPQWDSRASRSHAGAVATTFELLELDLAAVGLVEGVNTLAIHAFNNSTTSTDFLILPVLDAVDFFGVKTDELLFFGEPTPGKHNRGGFPAIAAKPVASAESGAYAEISGLTLTPPAPEAVVRFTVNGTEPDASSEVYSAPLAFTRFTTLKARTFQPGLLPSPTARWDYVITHASTLGFTSNLPLLVINTQGRTVSSNGQWVDGHMLVLEPGTNGRTAVTGAPAYSGNAAVKVRGSSTAGRPKPSLSVEFRNERLADRDVRVLGLPEESDFVLWGPYNFDLAMMRNPLIYELSNQVGRYAVRTRYCEVYLNQTAGVLSQAAYMGVYVFMEKIKRGPDRVDIAKLTPSDNEEPEVSGGYISKIDRLDPGDAGFLGAGQRMGFVEPKEQEATLAQKAWVANYFNRFGSVLNGPGFADPVNGYVQYIDPLSWIDHHLLNVFAKNVDALRLSGYMFKNREGRIEMGPIWDFDRSMDSTDGRDDAVNTWNGTGDGTPFFTYPWWVRLFQDPEFDGAYKDRWLDLRGGPMSNANLLAIIDGYAAEIGEAQVRNYQKWGGLLTRGNWQSEVTRLKNWVTARADWMDTQFVRPPELSHPAGRFETPFELTMTARQGEIYYTLNGGDPSDGPRPAADAVVYRGTPIPIATTTRVRARARISAAVWSPLAEATYFNDHLTLAVTEIMYNPPPDPDGLFTTSDLEFLELRNTGAEAIDLAGVSVGERLRFAFADGDVQRLEPGEHVVLTRDTAAFQSRYGTQGIRVAGEYFGLLSNASQEILIAGALGQVYSRFTYEDGWYPETDGGGHSLVIRDSSADPETWGDASSWRASVEPNGSPGREDERLDGRRVPGDATGDGRLNVADVVHTLRYLFQGATELPCESEAGNTAVLDVNGDQAVNVTDSIQLLSYIYLRGAPPALGTECVTVPGCSDACALAR